MLLTTNYKMKKIELKDSPPDITVINSNWDWLDTMIKTLHDSTNTWETFKQSGGKLFNSLEFKNFSENVDQILTTKKALGIKAGTKGIVVDEANNALHPDSESMDTMTMGSSAYGFKDFILAGGVSVKDTLNGKAVYETGTWTPVLYGSAAGSNTLDDVVTSSCHWMRIGNLVIAFFSLEVRSWPSSYGSQTLLIRGVPYARNLNKFSTGVITRYYGTTNNLQASILSINGHDSSPGAYWLHRSVTGMGTYGSVQLSWMNQTFGLAGYIMYSI